MRRVVFLGTVVAMLALAAIAYAAVITCEGGTCQGTPEADVITGSLTPDAIFADAGRDRVEARAGQDYAQGATGTDALEGNRGDDSLRGNRGYDLIIGGDGDDTIFGGPNPDEPPINGGVAPAGALPLPDEQLTDTSPDDEDTVYGGHGYELIDVKDGDGDDSVNCGPDGAEVHADLGDQVECLVQSE